jgi:hypothetical protein
MSETKKRRGGPPGSGMTVRVVTLSEKAAGEVRRRSALLGPRQRKDEASRTVSEIIEQLADGQLLLITDEMRAAVVWLQEARGVCFDETAQRGLDQLISGLWVART